MLSKIKTKIHMGFFTFLGRCKVAFFALALLSSTMTAWSQCPLPLPTKTQTGQTVCAPKAEDVTLSVINIVQGVGLKYYATEKFGQELPINTVLQGPIAIVWVSQSNGQCESERVSVPVTIFISSDPVIDSPQRFCNDPQNPPTVSQIVTGIAPSELRIYHSSDANTEIDPATPMVSGDTYLVRRVVAGCDSGQVPVQVLLDNLLVPEVGVPFEFCEDSVPANDINLWGQFANKPAETGTWTTNAPGITPPATFDGNINITGLGIGNYTFTYTVPSPDGNQCPDQLNTVAVNVVKFANSGVTNTVNKCSADPVFNLFDELLPDPNLGIPDAGGTWTPALASGGNHFDPAVDQAGIYIYTVNNNVCPVAVTPIIVNIQQQDNPGVSSEVTFCENVVDTTAPFDLITHLGPTVTPGGTWSTQTAVQVSQDDRGTIDIAGLAVGDYVFTYTLLPVGICPAPAPSTVTVKIEEFKTAGTSGNLQICSNEGEVDLTARIGGDAGGVWTFTDINDNNNQVPFDGTFDPAVDPAGEYTYTVTNQSCSSDQSVMQITIGNFVDPGTGTTLNFCEPGTDPAVSIDNAADLNLWAQLTGTPDAGGTWTDPQGAVIPGGNQPADQVISGLGIGTYNYTYTTTGDCNNTAVVSVVVDPLPDAGGVIAPVTVCSTDGNFDLNAQLVGAQAGGVWTAPGGAVVNSNLDLATAVQGQYTYTVTSVGCQASATQTIDLTITPAANTGTPIGDIEYCITTIGTQPDLLLANTLNGEDAGGVWSVPQGSPLVINNADQANASANVTALPVGDYNVTYTIPGDCSLAPSTITISVKPQLTAGAQTSTGIQVCSAGNSVDLFTRLEGNPTQGGTWTFNGQPISGIINPQFAQSGDYTYTMPAGICVGQATNTINVQITPSANSGGDGEVHFCEADLGTIAPFELKQYLQDTNPDAGSWVSPGFGVVIQTAYEGLVDVNTLPLGAHQFVFTTNTPDATDCESSSTVTVYIDPNQVEGGNVVNANNEFCSLDGNTITLSSLLDGTQTAGGVWTDTDNGNAVIANQFNPQNAGVGTYNYRYTVTSQGCNQISDFVDLAITVVGPANAGSDSALNFCIDDPNKPNALLLINELIGVGIDNGGTWTDNGGAALGDNTTTVDVSALALGSHVYTYTVDNGNQCGAQSATVTIIIDPRPDSGVAVNNGAKTIVCSSDLAFDLATLLSGEQAGGVWTNLSNQVVSNMFDPQTATIGLHKFNYTVTSKGCNVNKATQVVVEVTQGPNAGTSATVEFCEGELAGLGSYNILGALGANVDQNGTWNNPAVINNTIDLTGATVGTTVYTYTVPASQGSTCVADVKTVTITIQPRPEPGQSVLPLVPVCSSELAFNLNDLLVNEVAGGVWTNSAGVVVNGTFDPSSDQSDVFTYTVTSSSCSVPTRQVNVTILVQNNPPQVTSFASLGNVCSGNPAQVTIQGTADAVVTIDYAGNTSGVQQVTLTGGTGAFQTLENVNADTQFTISSISYAGPKGCPQVVNANNTATVTVEQTPTATISGSSTICSGSASAITFGGTVGATVTYTRSDVQGNQQITLTGGAADTLIPTPALTATTTFTLVSVTSPAGCSDNSLNGSAVITVLSPSTANLDVQNTLTACRNSSPTLNITGATPNATITYTRSDDVGTDYTVTTDGTGALTSPITINNIQNDVTVTLTRLDVTTNGLTCSTVITNQTQTIVVSQQPTAGALTTTAAQFNNAVCSGGNVGIQFTGGTAGAVVTYQVFASDGVTQIGQDRTVTLLNNGTYNGTSDISNITQDIIIRITKVTQGCENNSPGIVDLPIAVTVPPVVANAKVSVQSNGSVCFGTTATVDITDASSLPDATYDVTYVLSGDNSNGAGTIVAVTFNGGAGSFVIPTNQLVNAGSTDVQIQSINLGNGCDIAGATFNDNDATITVHALVPDLTRSTSDLYLCVLDGQTFTFNDLKSEFTVGSGFEIIWYDSSGVQKTGVGIPDSKVTNGVYYAELINSSSTCPSPNRFQLNVFIDKCHSAPNVVTPNSPNVGGPGTGATDANVFQIYDIQFLFPKYSYDVYNRYGVKLFTGDINNPIWDGKSTEGNLGVNEVVPTGVYYYVINFNDGKTKPEQGYFYLSR